MSINGSEKFQQLKARVEKLEAVQVPPSKSELTKEIKFLEKVERHWELNERDSGAVKIVKNLLNNLQFDSGIKGTRFGNKGKGSAEGNPINWHTRSLTRGK